MNPVLMLAHNNLEGTKRSVESVLAQDISINLIVIDNDSSPDIRQWLVDNGIACPRYSPQLGVTKAWNIGLEACFDFFNCEHCLVVNNDVVLPRWFYSALIDVCDGISKPGLISGVSVNYQIRQPLPPITSLSSNPDFSAFLIRLFLWRELGGFDERMVLYASDCDFHVRAHQAGYRLVNSGYPYYHERSSTLRTVPAEERVVLERQADADRQAFRAKWGCIPGEPEYNALFEPVLK